VFLAQDKIVTQLSLLNDLHCGQDPNGHGKIKGSPFLLHIGWSQVDGDSSGGKVIATVLDGGLDPILGLLDRTFRKPNGSKGREALSDVYLHFDDIGIDSKNSTAQDPGQHDGLDPPSAFPLHQGEGKLL
jgi:hypothetical protein